MRAPVFFAWRAAENVAEYAGACTAAAEPPGPIVIPPVVHAIGDAAEKTERSFWLRASRWASAPEADPRFARVRLTHEGGRLMEMVKGDAAA